MARTRADALETDKQSQEEHAKQASQTTQDEQDEVARQRTAIGQVREELDRTSEALLSAHYKLDNAQRYGFSA